MLNVPGARVLVIVRSIGRRLFSTHTELRRRDTGTGDPFGPYGAAIDRKTAERPPQIFERQTGVEQCAEDHVASRTGEAVEMQNRQAEPILSRPSHSTRRSSRPASTSEK